MFDIVCFGSATLDIFADTFDRTKESKENKIMRYEHKISYPTGSKILINDLNLTIGGGGTNTALTFSRFGFKTAYCGGLGKDSSGMMIRSFLEENRIKFIGPMLDVKTNLSVILDSIEHDRTILAYKGSSNYLKFNQIPDLEQSQLIYSSSMMGESFLTFKKLVKLYSKKSVLIAFNPSEYQAKEGFEKLKDILIYCDFLILNKEEAQDILGDFNPDVAFLLRKLKPKLSLRSIVVITDAQNGAYAIHGSKIYHAIPKKVKIIETTGAGDAFASAFIGGFLKDANIVSALKLGLANAESVITNRGAKEIILTYDDAKSLVKKRNYKVQDISLK